MLNNLQIRRATASDTAAIHRIEQRCFPANEAFCYQQLYYLICKARGCCYVAYEGSAILGYISILTRNTAHNLRIYSVAVAPEARGKGVGQALIETAIAEAQQLGLSEITLEVRTDNLAASNLYLRNGFTRQRTLIGYYPDGTDAWRMAKRM